MTIMGTIRSAFTLPHHLKSPQGAAVPTTTDAEQPLTLTETVATIQKPTDVIVPPVDGTTPITPTAPITSTTPSRPLATIAADLEAVLKESLTYTTLTEEFVKNWITKNYDKLKIEAETEFNTLYAEAKADVTAKLNSLVIEYNAVHQEVQTKVSNFFAAIMSKL